MNNAQVRMIELAGAADFLGPGAIEVPEFETEIVDIIRRESVALNRLPSERANGHPHRYFEQTAIASAVAVDPRNLASAATSPTRVERSAPVKAAISQTNIGLFDKEITQQQGRFGAVVAKDIEDIVSAVQVKRASMLWIGTDTSLTTPTTLEWMGGFAQITLQATIVPGASIIDGIKAQVAAMVANQTFKAKPTAIYVNPVLADYIDQEAKAYAIELGKMDIGAGVVVASLNTQAGTLPLIGDAFIPADTTAKYGFGAPPAGNKNYYAAILTEKMVEMPYVSGETDNPLPRLFQLGLIGNLSGQYVGVKFDAVVFKGASYAHCVVAVQRP
ncbi:MAG TPA: hypothetical protein VK138_02675 [Acidiferrobacterales bacterium]|nr:hypothetical protein [Acidiferrobacterales bacterium]